MTALTTPTFFIPPPTLPTIGSAPSSFPVAQATSGVQHVLTPSGYTIDVSTIYTPGQKAGVQVLIVASLVSLISVLALLVILGIAARRTIRSPQEHRFMRTHVVAYFISLLFSDIISSLGSLLNIAWVSNSGVRLSPLCTAQGALKNAGNVGTAMWTTVIAFHTFSLLVLKWRIKDYVLYITLFVVWSFIGLVVIIGPAAVQDFKDKGPYFGVSGFWCWITDPYPAERITLEYLWMFLAVGFSALLYSAVFLSLRGNLVMSNRRVRFNWKPKSGSSWQRSGGETTQAMNFAKHMLLYPIAYGILVLPIAICRFMTWAGADVPFEATIFAATVFLLSGFVNVVLFTTTRRLIPGGISGSRILASLFSKNRGNSGAGGNSSFSTNSSGFRKGSSEKFDLERQDSVNSAEFAPVTPFIVDSQKYYSSVVDENPGEPGEMASYAVLDSKKSLNAPIKLTLPPQAKIRTPVNDHINGHANGQAMSHEHPPQTLLETIPLSPANNPSVANFLDLHKSASPTSTSLSDWKKGPRRGASLVPTVASVYSQDSLELQLPKEPVPSLPGQTGRVLVAGPRKKPSVVRKSRVTGNDEPGMARDTIGITDYYRYTAIMNSVAEAEPREPVPDVPALGLYPPVVSYSRKESQSKSDKAPAFVLPYSSENPPPTLPRRSHERSISDGKRSNRASASTSYKVTPYPYEYAFSSRTSEESVGSAESSMKTSAGSVGSDSGHSRNGSGSSLTVGHSRKGSGGSSGGRYI